MMVSNLGELLSASARRFGAKTALVAPDGSLSFAELDELATNFAANLRAAGIVPGDVVTLWLENGWRWMAAYYGALRAGAVVNAVNAMLTPAELDYILRDCGSRLVLGPAARLGELAPLPGLRLLDEEQGLTGMLARPEAAHLSAAAAPGPRTRAAVCYTSGTTGRPKGAALSHRAVLLNTAMTSLMHGRGTDDVVVSALPCAHVYGNVVMNAAIACGMTLVLFPRFEEEPVFEAIARHGATLLEGVPTMFMRLLNHPALRTAQLGSLRRCTVGGQTMPVSTMAEVEQRFGCRLLELWGMTELAGLGTTHPHNAPGRLGSIGVPMPLYEARIADLEDPQRILRPGEVGELQVRGPSVMEGYLNNPEATREAIDDEGWLRTGDLAHRDAEGYIFVVDRKKDMILTAGYNVYPAEIERVVASHPAVAMVAVGRVNDERKGELAKAYVVLRPGATATAESIVAHCRGELAAYKLPRQVQFVPDLPKTSTGKILRRELHRLDEPSAT